MQQFCYLKKSIYIALSFHIQTPWTQSHLEQCTKKLSSTGYFGAGHTSKDTHHLRHLHTWHSALAQPSVVGSHCKHHHTTISYAIIPTHATTATHTTLPCHTLHHTHISYQHYTNHQFIQQTVIISAHSVLFQIQTHHKRLLHMITTLSKTLILLLRLSAFQVSPRITFCKCYDISDFLQHHTLFPTT